MSMFDLIPFASKSRDLFDTLDRRASGDMTASLGDFRTDIIEEAGRYVLECELPGFRREDISVDIADDRLTITAKANPDSERARRSYVHRERRVATWQRSFSLSNIETQSITASYTDGILTLSLPKVQPKAAQSRKIEIQ